MIDSWIWGLSDKVIVPPDAVNGPTVAPGDGTVSVRPEGGTGVGIGTLKLIVPDDTDAGVAPSASMVAVADPMIETLPRADAALTMFAGNGTWDW